MAEFTRSRSGKTAEEFVAEAEKATSEAVYPWENGDPRIPKHFNLRLDEVTLAKLRYIADHVPESMQGWCRKVLLSAIDEKIVELTGGNKGYAT